MTNTIDMRHIKGLVILILFIVQPVCAEAELINKVIAVVNDEVITQQDASRLLAVLYAQYANMYEKDELVKKMEELKKNILKQMIEDKLILSRAKELNINVTEEEVNDKLGYIKNGFPSEKDFYELLEAQGITMADLKDRYRDQIMVKKIVDLEVKSRVMVLPSEVTEYYEKHKSEFKDSGKYKYKVRHIMIKAEDEVSLELAKVEIQDIYNKLKEGQDFAELAKRYSQGPNKDQGGDMGYIEQGEMLEELDKVIFTLKPGEFSEPVKSKIGYHIFKVEDIKDASYFNLADQQNDIKNMLFQERFKKRLDEWLAELSSKAYISIK